MVIQAIFMGKSESMGFIPFQTYMLEVKEMTIYCKGRRVPYESLRAFFLNWSMIQVIDLT